MRTLLALIICSAFLISSASFAQQKTDAEYQAAINKDSRAETPRYDYAYYLYTKKMFKESRAQLGYLFGLNPTHPGGRKLLKHIDEIEGVLDTAYQDQQMRVFMLAKMEEDRERANQAATDVLTPERILQIQEDLEKRYGFNTRLKTEARPEPGEVQFQENFNNSRKNGELDKTEKIARSWIAQFEKSPIAKADFGAFLITRDRLPQAEVLVSGGLAMSPDCMKLRIVSDLLKELKGVKSSEKTLELKRKLKDELTVYQLAVSGKLQEALRVPATAPGAQAAVGPGAPTAPTK